MFMHMPPAPLIFVSLLCGASSTLQSQHWSLHVATPPSLTLGRWTPLNGYVLMMSCVSSLTFCPSPQLQAHWRERLSETSMSEIGEIFALFARRTGSVSLGDLAAVMEPNEHLAMNDLKAALGNTVCLQPPAAKHNVPGPGRGWVSTEYCPQYSISATVPDINHQPQGPPPTTELHIIRTSQ